MSNVDFNLDLDTLQLIWECERDNAYRQSPPGTTMQLVHDYIASRPPGPAPERDPQLGRIVVCALAEFGSWTPQKDGPSGASFCWRRAHDSGYIGSKQARPIWYQWTMETRGTTLSHGHGSGGMAKPFCELMGQLLVHCGYERTGRGTFLPPGRTQHGRSHRLPVAVEDLLRTQSTTGLLSDHWDHTKDVEVPEELLPT